MRTSMQGPFNGAFIHRLEQLFEHGTATGLTEGELLDRFVGGRDESAFEALVARHGPMVMGVCRQLLRDPNDVDDAFQATFLVLVRRVGTLRRRDLLGNWLYGVAHRVAMRSRVLAARRLSRAPHGQDVVERLDAGDGRRNGDETSRLDPEPEPWLHEEIRRLPEKYRTLVLLCYFEGLTHEQAALRLGCPLGTVKGRLARARELLRKRLTRRGITLSAAAVAAHLARADVHAAVPEALKYATLKAARSIATTSGASIVAATSVSLPVAALTDGVLRAMIITPAKVIVIPLLIAGILTTGAVIGAAQYGGMGDPSLEQVQIKSGRGNRLKKRAPRETVSEKGRPAADLLAEEVRGDQEMFDYLTADNRDVRHDDTQMLIRLSQRMLAVSLDVKKDHASRLDAYKAHRDRLTKLFKWTQHESGARSASSNHAESNLVSARMKEADDLIEQEKKSAPAASSEDAKTNVAQTKTAATKAAEPVEELGVATTTAAEPNAEEIQAAAESRARFVNRLEIAKLAGAVEARGVSPKNQALLKKLEQRLELTTTHPTKLKDILDHIRSELMEPNGKTIPIYVDAKGLEDAGVNLETSVPMDVEGLPLKMALRVLLRRLGLAYCVRDGVLIISSIQGIREELAEAVSELLGSEPNALQGVYLPGMGGFMGGMGGGMGGMGGGMGGMGGGMMGGGMR